MRLYEIFQSRQAGYPITDTKRWSLNTTEYLAHTADGREISIGIGYDSKSTTRRNHGFDAMTVSFAVDNEVGLTGRGDAIAVLNTVYRVVEQQVQRNHPEYVVFSGADASHQKIYSAMVRRLAGNYQRVPYQDLPAMFKYYLGSDQQAFVLRNPEYALDQDREFDEAQILQFPGKKSATPALSLPRNIRVTASDWYWAEYESGGLDATLNNKGYGTQIANDIAYEKAKLQQYGYTIDFDDDYENIVLTNRQGQKFLLPIEDAQNQTGWHQDIEL